MRKITLEIPESVFDAMRYEDCQVQGILKYAGSVKADFLPTIANPVDGNNSVRVKCISSKTVKSITIEFKDKEE